MISFYKTYVIRGCPMLFGLFSKKNRKKGGLGLKKEKEKDVIIKFFNTPAGITIFKMIIEYGIENREDTCPLNMYCGAYFAKCHDTEYPNFFVNPCWTMTSSCLCPIRKIVNCDSLMECPRRKRNTPLC